MVNWDQLRATIFSSSLQLKVYGRLLEKLITIITDIKHLFAFFDTWEIKHVLREANFATDWIANVRHLISGNMYVDSTTSESYLLLFITTSYK